MRLLKRFTWYFRTKIPSGKYQMDPYQSKISGYIAVSLFGYYFPDWREYSLAMALSNSIGVFTFFMIPESFMFLYQAGKYKQGRSVIRLFADKTNTPLSEEYLSWFHEEAIKSNSKSTRRSAYSILDLFRNGKTLALVVINSACAFGTCSMTYYGLSLNAASLPGNLYVNNAVNGGVEFLAYGLCMLILGAFIDFINYK